MQLPVSCAERCTVLRLAAVELAAAVVLPHWQHSTHVMGTMSFDSWWSTSTLWMLSICPRYSTSCVEADLILLSSDPYAAPHPDSVSSGSPVPLQPHQSGWHIEATRLL